jgi:hypothetical protein
MPEPRRRQPKPDKRRGMARRKHGAPSREQGGGPKPSTRMKELTSQPPAGQPEVLEPAASWIEPTDAPADESGLALVDQTFTPEEGEQAREQAEAEREEHEARAQVREP